MEVGGFDLDHRDEAGGLFADGILLAEGLIGRNKRPSMQAQRLTLARHKKDRADLWIRHDILQREDQVVAAHIRQVERVAIDTHEASLSPFGRDGWLTLWANRR